LDELNIKYENLSALYQQNVEKSKGTNQHLENGLAEKNREIASLKKEIQEKRENILTNSAKLDEQNTKILSLEEEIRTLNKKKSGSIPQSNTRESRNRNDQMSNEVEKLKFEVRRLVKLLRTTKEFKDFTEFSHEGMNNTIKPVGKHLRTQSTDHRAISTGSQDKHQFMGTNKYLPKREKIIYEQFSKVFEQFVSRNQGNLSKNNIQDLALKFTEIWNQNKNKAGKSFLHNRTTDETQNYTEENKYNIPSNVRITSGTHNERFKDRSISDASVFHSMHTSQMNTQRKSFENLLQGTEEEIIQYCESLRRNIELIINEFTKKRKELLDRHAWNSEISMMCRKEDWLLENIETALTDFSRGLSMKFKNKNKMATPPQLNVSVL